MRVAQLCCAHLQIVQQRMLPGMRDVRIVRQIPRTVEETIRVAALGCAIVYEMMGRVGTGGGYVGIACDVPVRIEETRQSIAEIDESHRFRFVGRGWHAGRFPQNATGVKRITPKYR